jgi:hypothetical protein
MFQWADLDNDNDLDVVAGGCTSYCYNWKMLSIYRNDGANNFTLITAQTNLIGGKLFTLADYDNDGLIDIEIATQSDNDDSVIGHLFYKNTGNFVFQKTFELPVTSGEVAWGDLDNDGWEDFILRDNAYQNLRDGTFQPFTPAETMPPDTRHFVFDADNDGDLDAVTSSGILVENDGSGHLSIGQAIVPYDYIRSLVIADFDDDGDKDMAVSGSTSAGPETQLFRSEGALTFTAEDLNERYPYSYTLAVGDMDNDEDPDILISGVYVDDIVILENGLASELSPPFAPANLGSSSDAEAVTLTWDPTTTPEQPSMEYNVYLMRGNDFKIAPNADPATGVSFVPGFANAASALQKQILISVMPEGYYRWSVQAVDGSLNTSPFADPQEFTLYKDNPANAPTNLSSTVQDRSVSLTWTDNASDESGFTIERSSVDGNSGFESVGQLNSDAVTFTDNAVLPRRVYYYRIRLDGSAEVAYSNVVSIVTPSAITTMPTSVTATALTSASAKIDWEYTDTGITGFVVERSPDDQKHFKVADSVSADQFSYTDQQLESGTTYYYRLYAINGNDFSDYSDVANVTMPFKEFNKITLSSLGYESGYPMGGIAWGDYDNDGFDDLFLAYKAQLFHNEGNGSFKQITETGIASSVLTSDVVGVWGDYDNDGFLDLFYYDSQNRISLYRGHGDGTFEKITTVINSDREDVANATWTDFDMDGDLDLSTGGRYVYRYDGNDRFVRVDFPGGIPAGYYRSSVASWADYDDDGDPDVFLGNYGKDEFFRNNGDGSFTAITDQRVTSDYNFDCCPVATPTALWTDFNNDRKLDLTLLHAGAPIYAYANHSNTLDSVFYYYDYNWESWKNVFWTDYDSDGDLDLFAMGQYNIKTGIWENKANLPFRRLNGGPLYDYVSTDAVFSWNDFDNDGYSDLFQFDSKHQVYKSLSNGNSWIKISLKGSASNSTGLGARVFVKSNGGWQRSDVTTHHSYRVQQGFMSLFGLGKATTVDSVIVLWPSGYRQYLTDVNVNQVIVVDESEAQEKVIQGPSNLSAESLFPSSIILHWTDRSDDETGFVIEMMNEEGQFEEAGTVGPGADSFSVNGLSVGVKYNFRVRASQVPGKWTNTAETQISLFSDVFGGDLTIFQSKPGGMAWGDPDGDGDPDLFVGSESFEPDAIYYNDNTIFTRKYLRNTSDYSRQAQWIDYDNDGDQDLHISVGGGIIALPEYLNDFLYENNGAGELIEQAGNRLAIDGYSDFTAAWGDLNKDGYLDMITPRPENKSPVFLNLGGNMIPQQGPSGLSQSGEAILLSDFDNDRDLDVISGGSYGYGYQLVFENTNGQFTSVSNTGLLGTPYSFVLEDFDNDGAQDMLMIDSDRKIRLFLIDPVSNRFKEKLNAFPEFGAVSKLSAGDFDNNVFLDVFVTGEVSFTSNTNRIFLNNGDLNFTSLPDPILQQRLFGSAIADVNRDGNLDMIALAGDGNYDVRRHLLLGSKNENHWLRVKLKGGAVNKFGIGARIRLFTGNTSQVRDIRSGGGGTFSDEQIAHFGLGAGTAVDYIKVEWPSGEDQWIANPSIDTEIIVEQAGTPGPPAPADPTNLEATFRLPAYIDLHWTDNSDNEKTFRIERAVGTDSFELFRNVSANTTSYSDSSFVNYTGNRRDVKYRVVAVSYVSVESRPSNLASAEIPFESASPSALTATLRDHAYVDLRWTDNSDNEKAFIIERASGSDPYEVFKNLPANTTSYRDSAFASYSEYHGEVRYRLSAMSHVSIVSAPSNEASVLIVITGIEEEDAKMVTIYPHPALSKVIVQSTHMIRNITIIDGRGQRVMEVSVPGAREVEVPLDRFASGIYYMRITDEKGTHMRKLLVAPGD